MARIAAVVVIYTLTIFGPAVGLADASTVGQLVAAIRTAATTANLPTVNRNAEASLEEAIHTLTNAGVLEEEISTFFNRLQSPDAKKLARRRQQHFTVELKPAMDTLKGIANTVLVDLNAVSDDVRRTVNEYQGLEQKAGLAWNLETLRLLERKYGPNSAKLNGVEVAAAFALQRVPGFGVDAKGRPQPFEAILAYAPSYISYSDDNMRVMGVAEIGLRTYIFKKGWGKSGGRWAWLRPGYTSYGVAWTSNSDDPMRPPWQGDSRFGAFFGWGEMKMAWIVGDDRRFLVTQQFQIVPWVF
jgi:hypothetical protein